jgi:hypothetical protein
MDQYIRQLQHDYQAGRLLMECIAPDAYDTLVKAGYMLESEYEVHMADAIIYLHAWAQRNNRTLHNLLDCPGQSLELKHQQMEWVKMNTAKKLAVYEFLSKSKELPNETL